MKWKIFFKVMFQLGIECGVHDWRDGLFGTDGSEGGLGPGMVKEGLRFMG
jgi:hypothetical protein